jgi:hypothetical protein
MWRFVLINVSLMTTRSLLYDVPPLALSQRA